MTIDWVCDDNKFMQINDSHINQNSTLVLDARGGQIHFVKLQLPLHP